MHILLIDQNAGAPSLDGDLRSYTLAREWERAGIRATVLAAAFSPLRRKNPEERPLPAQAETVDGVSFVFLPVPPAVSSPGGWERDVYAFAWALRRQAGELARLLGPQAVLLSSGHPFDFWGGERLAAKSGAALAFELREAWPQIQGELYGKRAAKGPARFTLRRALKKSICVFSPLSGAAACLQEFGIPAEKLRPVSEPVAGEPETQPLSERNRDYLERLRRCYDFLILYQGPVARRRQLGLLIDAAKLLEETGTAVLIIGNGDYKISLKRQIRGLAAANVYLMDDIGPQAQAACRYADCLYYGDSLETAVRYGAQSGALLARMRAGKPLLTALRCSETPPELAGSGVNAAEPSAEALASAIESLRAAGRPERAEMGLRGVHYLQENHDPARCAQAYLAALEETVRGMRGAEKPQHERADADAQGQDKNAPAQHGRPRTP